MQEITVVESTPIKRFRALDSFRGIASLWIVCFHFIPPPDRIAYGPILGPLIGMGFLGTDIFFIISGFGASIAAQRILQGRQAVWSFITLRLRRVYLNYWFSLVLAVLILPTLLPFLSLLKGHPLSFDYFHYSFGKWVRIITLTQIFSGVSWKMHEPFVSLNAVVWYIAILIQMYFVVAAAMLFKKHFDRILLFITFISILSYIPPIKAHIPYGLFLYKWLHFSVGILLFRLIQRETVPSLQNTRSVNLHRVIVLIFIGLVYAVCILQSYVSYENGSFYNEYRLLCAVTVGTLFWLVYPFDHTLSRTPVFRFFGFLGVFSYSTYLLQMPLWGLTDMVVRHFVPLPPFINKVAVMIPLTLLLSLVWFMFFERPGSLSGIFMALRNPLKTLYSIPTIWPPRSSHDTDEMETEPSRDISSAPNLAPLPTLPTADCSNSSLLADRQILFTKPFKKL